MKTGTQANAATYNHHQHQQIKALSGVLGQRFVPLNTIDAKISGWRCLFDGRIRAILHRHDPQLYRKAVSDCGPFLFLIGFAAIMGIPLVLWSVAGIVLPMGLASGACIFLFGMFVLSDIKKSWRSLWCEQVFLAQLHGLPRVALKELLDCAEVSESSKSRVLIYRAMEVMERKRADDILGQHLGTDAGQTVDTTETMDASRPSMRQLLTSTWNKWAHKFSNASIVEIEEPVVIDAPERTTDNNDKNNRSSTRL